jgi:hypothetical protein
MRPDGAAGPEDRGDWPGAGRDGAQPGQRGGFQPGSRDGTGPAASRGPGNRNKLLIIGAGVLAVIAIVAVIVVPKLLGPSDPGCASYSGSALPAYNITIHDINNQAPQATLTKDMTTTISQLNGAIAKAHSASVKSALTGLLAELKTVQSAVGTGSIPITAVNALNSAATAADNACK